jgi:uncharacterized protein
MFASLRWCFLTAVAVGLLGSLTPAEASKDSSSKTFRVEDGAGLFSKEALDKADKKIEDIKRDYDRDLLIETIKEVPENRKTELKDMGEGAFFRRWARERYKEKGSHGVYVLICKEPKYLYILVGEKTLEKAFKESNRKVLETKLRKELSDPSKALLSAVDYVESTMKENGVKASRSTVSKAVEGRGNQKKSEVNPVWGWICIGLVVLLAVWLLFGLVRAFSGGGGGGGPGGGGPGGGGGGGFFTSLLGGMFGAAAGMWLYDSFFRSHSPGDSWGSSAHAGESYSSGADDGTPGEGGGGAWGGGDDNAGGGGGDWGGGGGDAGGGGGDWGGGGGGGGDWGGGGGGDWGGGGGGDFGGGGGDW